MASCNNTQEKKAKETTEVITPDEANLTHLAEEAYIYALPIIMSYKTMYFYAVDPTNVEFKAPFNNIFNTRRVFGPKDSTVVSVNSDTPYSIMWLDVRDEPQILTIPTIEEGRYYSVMFQDLSTYLLPYIGTRTTGNNGGNYMVARQGWEGDVPENIDKVIYSSTDFIFTVCRTQLINSEDMPNVARVQDGYQLQTLSDFLGTQGNEPKPGSFIPWSQNATGNDFIRYINFCLQFIQTDQEEREFLETLRPLGVGAGKPFEFSTLEKSKQEAIRQGVTNAIKKINDNMDKIDLAGHTAEDYNHDWLLRATVTQLGWGANDPKEASYPLLNKDAEGRILDGSAGDYTLTFQKDELPPVKAFWSITMYDAKTKLMIENPIDRYILNSPMLPDMNFNADGSLTLYFQADNPGKEKEGNWLPAPEGPFYMLMRLYGPQDAFFDGSWKVPEIEHRNQ